MINITPIAVAVVTLLGLIITTFIIPYIKAKIGAEKLNKLLTYAAIGVKAAEQIFKETGMGVKKKEYVSKFLAEHGFILDGDELDVVIESAVFEMKNELMM